MAGEGIKADAFKKVVGTLNGKDNYLAWSGKAELYFKSELHTWPIVNGTLNRPKSEAEEKSMGITGVQWDLLDAKILAALVGSLNDGIFAGLSNKSSSSKVWSDLRNIFGTHFRGDRLARMEELSAIKLEPGMTVSDFNNVWLAKVAEIGATGRPIDPAEQVDHYLRAIKDMAKIAYNHFFGSTANVTVYDVMAYVLSAEKNGALEQTGTVFATQRSGSQGVQQKQCFKCKGFGHFAQECANTFEVDHQGFIRDFGNLSVRGRGTWRGRGNIWRGGRGGRRGGRSSRGFGRGSQINAVQQNMSNADGNIEDNDEYFHGVPISFPEVPIASIEGNTSTLIVGERKTHTTGPVPPHAACVADSEGWVAPRNDSLSPQRGPFGSDPPKRGSNEDTLKLTAHVVSASSSAHVNFLSPQDMVSLMAIDTSHKVYVDSGATDTITPLRNAVTDFAPAKIHVSLAGEGTSSTAQGRGTLGLAFHTQSSKFHFDIPKTIVDVGVRSTYLATGSLQEIGITTIFPGDSSWCILLDRSGNEICRGKRHTGRLYDMPIMVRYPMSSAYSAKCLSAKTYNVLHHALGHLRLAHINTRDLENIVKAGKLKDVQVDDLAEPLFCYGCRVGKATNLPYTQIAREKVTQPGGRVHLDIWGPISTPGLKGERFMLLFVDEASQHIAGVNMKSKSEAPQHIKNYKVFMEKQYPGFELKILRSDNAKEILLSKEMLAWMQSLGIHHEESPPYTPQLNGKAERAMRTVFEPVRSIMALGKLRLTLWSELVQAVIHTKNHVPSSATNGKVPLEILTGKKIDLSHLRVLGCDAYALYKAPGRNKLQQKADQYILVGYGVDAGTYRLFDPKKRSILISRDVVFNEEGFIRKHYLPYRDHFGMGPDFDDHSEEFTLPPNDPETLLIPSQQGNDDDNDDDEDDDKPSTLPQSLPIAEPAIPATPPRPPVAVNQRDRATRRVTSAQSLPTRREVSPTPFVVQHEEDPPALGQVVPPAPLSPDPIAEYPVSVRRSVPQPKGENNMDRSNSEDELTAAVNWITLETSEKIPIPKTIEEVLNSAHYKYWWAAMQDEVDALIANQTWDLVDKSKAMAKTIITGKWVWDLKQLGSGKVRFKARWVARGFTQVPGLDYKETFAPVMNGKSWHIMFALSAALKQYVSQMDVANAFLNGRLNETIYMEQPHGFETGDMICELKKSIYGLKQAANVWFEELKKILTEKMGFQALKSDSVVFMKELPHGKIYVGGHVDDLLIFSPEAKDQDNFRDELEKHLKIKRSDLGTYLGVETHQDPKTGTISIHHYTKIVELLENQGMLDSAPVSTPIQPGTQLSRGDCPPKGQELPEAVRRNYRSAVGSLMHIMTMTRPDICTAVKMLSEALDNPSINHTEALKWLLRYLNGTRGWGITYYGKDDPKRHDLSKKFELHGYYDANWGQDAFDRKSRSGYVFMLSGGAVTWGSGKQELVAASTTHAEYIGQDSAARELEWILQLLKEMGLPPDSIPKIYGHGIIDPLPSLYGDNQPAQKLAKNAGNHKGSKHIDIKYHRIRELLEKKVLKLIYVPSKKNTADIMTKALDKGTFEMHREGMGMGLIREDSF